MAHELRIQVVIPLQGDAVARAGGDIKVDVIKAKPRAAKGEAH